MLDDRPKRVLVERDRSRAISDPELWLDIGLRFRYAFSMALDFIGCPSHGVRAAPIDLLGRCPLSSLRRGMKLLPES